jgi:ATP-binding cassette subfamily B protein
LQGKIEFSRVSFRYSMQADPALIGVSVDIEPGGSIAVTGQNGGGKSTFLKLLLGMYVPQAGTIRIDGVDIRQIDPVNLRRLVGYVPQDLQFFRATIAQNLRFAQPDATDDELKDALELAGAWNQVSQLPRGLDYRIGDGASEQIPASLRQKMALARAYLTRAPILLFDEPGAGLDGESDACFTATLQALKGKRTVIFISHRPSHMKIADTVLLFQGGYLQGAASPEELFRTAA